MNGEGPTMICLFVKRDILSTKFCCNMFKLLAILQNQQKSEIVTILDFTFLTYKKTISNC